MVEVDDTRKLLETLISDIEKSVSQYRKRVAYLIFWSGFSDVLLASGALVFLILNIGFILSIPEHGDLYTVFHDRRVATVMLVYASCSLLVGFFIKKNSNHCDDLEKYFAYKSLLLKAKSTTWISVSECRALRKELDRLRKKDF